MYKKLSYVIISILVSCSLDSSNSSSDNLHDFNNYLGKEKAEALEEAVTSFDRFLKSNFPEPDTYNEKVIEFLNFLADNNLEPNPNWKLNAKSNSHILKRFEETTLRADIWRYGFENFTYDNYLDSMYMHLNDSIFQTQRKSHKPLGSLDDLDLPDIELPEIPDSILKLQNIKDSIRFADRKHGSRYSQYVIGFYLHEKEDTSVQLYVKSKLIAGSISPHLIVSGLLNEESAMDFSSPFTKILIVMELFFNIMEWDIARNGI